MTDTTIVITTAAHSLAWWIGYLGMIVGVYLVFVCERHDPLLIGYGFVISALGVSVFTTIRNPGWLPSFLGRDLLITTTLALISIVVIYATYLVWQWYNLKPPWVRFREILTFCGEWLQDKLW